MTEVREYGNFKFKRDKEGEDSMEKVNVFRVSALTWECPNCGTHNITEEYCDMICCECDEEVEVN